MCHVALPINPEAKGSWVHQRMDDDAFEALYGAIQPQLLRHARFALDEHTAYEVVNATFETLLRKRVPILRTSDEAIARIRPLAFAILRGKITNEYRARDRRQNLQRVIAQRRTSHLQDHAQEVAERSEVQYFLAKLSANDREVILLFNAGYTTEEIAELLRCTRTAAARRRDRAKQRLRTLIEEDRRADGDDPASTPR